MQLAYRLNGEKGNHMTTTINTHGINIDLDRLHTIAEATENTGSEIYQTIGFDRENGDLHIWEGLNDNWVEWRDPAIITVCHTRRHHSAQWLADKIRDAMLEDRRITSDLGEVYAYGSIWEG